MKKTYTINNQQYSQSPLVIGQLPRLLAELQGVSFTSFDLLSLITAFGSKLHRIMACVLVPEGQTPDQVDIEAVSENLINTPVETALEVLEDFLGMTSPLESILKRVTARIKERTKTMTGAIGPQPSAPISPEETP